ncbi:MAG: tol-pal system protein YbgF [Desulfuromonadaceae bacterium]|nr:tol-pal system protein YbgF [Desulfuromonadaceae bacterium]
MPFCVRLTTPLLFCIALTGCATNDLVAKRQTESEAKIEHLIQSARKSEQRLNELTGQQQSQADQVKGVAQQLKQYQETVRELRTSQEELKARLTLLAQQAATPRIELVNPGPAPKSFKDGGPPADYVKAFGLYSANNFASAIESFEFFIRVNPKSDYVANALYWIAECYYTLSDLPKARDAFQKVAEGYPSSPKAPDSLLKLGYTLTAMKEKEKALSIYDSLIKSYPSSPAAAKARERMGAN